MLQCYLTKQTKQYNQCKLKPALVLLEKKNPNCFHRVWIMMLRSEEFLLARIKWF